MTPAENTPEAGVADLSGAEVAPGNISETVLAARPEPEATTASQDATKDAGASEATETQAGSTRVYFTEGEMFPWKGRWFRIHLNASTKKIELEMVKPTAHSQKRFAREERWLRQHPKSDRAVMLKRTSTLLTSLAS
jgi:hypothetical protein